MKGDQEYKLLREAITSNFSGIRQYENVMYTSVAAILAFSINSNHYILCMIPYVVIISIFAIVMATKGGICKTAMYLAVFLEGEEFNWERRQLKYKWGNFEDEKIFPWRTHSQYFLLSFVCTISTLIKLWGNQTYSDFYKVIVSIIVLVFSLSIMLFFYKKAFSFEKARKEMKEHWLEIKKSERKKQESTLQR